MSLRPRRDWKKLVLSRTATGVVLLVLMAHAFVASTTHFHRLSGPARQVGYSGATLSAKEKTHDAPPAGDHSQCLICRLQRNFLSDLQQTPPSIAAPLAAALDFETVNDASVHSPQLLSPTGRAPPKA